MYRFPVAFGRLATALWSLVFVVVLGCGGNTGPQLFEVTGTVTVEGQPLEKAGISFRPDETKGNKSGALPAGVTDSAGKYVLQTASKTGAPAGHYKVAVVPYSAPPSGGEVPKSASLPFNKKYSLTEKSDLTFEVKAGSAPLVYDIKLTK